jgi:aspartyl-tRNA(Asn)/glutamyl-tRNA(Gln) amidotransferase subunit C
MAVDKFTLQKIAHLARLEINPQRQDEMLHDLEAMLAFVEKLKEVDTSGVEPLTSMSTEVNGWREDEVQPHLARAEALQQAPHKDEQFFKVPKVLE